MSLEEKMPPGTKVKLKSDCTQFYQLGTSKLEEGEPVFVTEGSEAFVMAHRKDDDEFDIVLVKWNRDDWRYQGQPDGWAYPAHFEVIEAAREAPETPTEEEKVVLSDMVKKAMAKAEDQCPHCGQSTSEHTDEEKVRENYLNILGTAVNKAAPGEGFMLLTVVEENREGVVTLVPHLYSGAMNDEAAILLEAQLAEITANAYRAFALARLKEVGKDGR
jgi:hypothetical protein